MGDLDQAAAFYHRALGLDLTVWSYPGALFLSAGGYHHHLGINTWAGPEAQRPSERDARLLEWILVLPSGDEVERAARSLEAASHAVRRLEERVVLADDPWGTTLRLVAA